MKLNLLKSTLVVGNVLIIAQPVTAATFDLSTLISNGPGATLTDDGITVTYEVFTSGTGDYRGSVTQDNIPIAVTNRPTNDTNAFDSEGNPIVNGAEPSFVNIQNYTVLTFRWDTTVTFIEGIDVNDFDFNHSPFPGVAYHDAAAVIAERSNKTFINATTSNFGSGIESYNANLIANPTNIVDNSGMELPDFLKNIRSVEAYRNNDHTPNTGPVNVLPSDPNFTATFQDDLVRISALHILYWNESQASDDTFGMGIGFSSAITVEEDLEIPESPISAISWFVLGLGGLFLKKRL